MSQELWEEEEEVVRWIQSIRHPTLTPRARRRIWRKAQERARVERAEPLVLRLFRFRPVGIALLVVFALILSSFGTVLAAQSSMPIDFLYPIKRASEEAWWALTPEWGRPDVALELALRRMEEVEYLIDEGVPVPEDLLAALEACLEQVDQAGGMRGRERALARVQHHVQVLEQQIARHPENPGLQRALEASRHALDVLSGPLPSPLQPTTTPTATFAPPGLERTPPGQQLTPPGQGGTPPGQQLTPPGQGGIPPGQQLTPPGQGGTPPGQQLTPPGQGGTPPGQQPTPPGQGKGRGNH